MRLTFMTFSRPQIQFWRLLTLCLLFLVYGVAAQAKPTLLKPCALAQDYTPILQREEKALLYRIEKCDEPTSYVFGTFHSDAPVLTPLFEKVTATFTDVDAVALELVVTPKLQRIANQQLSLPVDHAGLQTLLDDALWQKASRVARSHMGITPERANRYQPWALAVLVQYPKPESDGIVLDQKIQQAAFAAGKKLVSLENLKEQFSVFQNLSLKDQLTFLDLTMQGIDEIDESHNQLRTLYLAQDTNAIMDLSDALFEQMNDDYPSLATYLKHALIDERNETMAQRIAESTGTATTFAVGALHLPGPQGVLHLLEQQGYYIFPQP